MASIRRDSGITRRGTTGLSVNPVRKASTLDSSHGPTPPSDVGPSPASSVPVAHLWARAVGDQFHKSSREHSARQQTHGWHFRKPRLARF